jgi:amidase
MTTELDATALAELVRSKKAKPSELVEDVIRRIDALNPKLNAVVTRMDDEARAAARAKDAAAPSGPFFGVPMLVKDILGHCKGVRTTSGSRYFAEYVPQQDSELVARFRRAGFVIVGKTNVPEFGFLPTTEPRLFGAAKNPWALDRTTGGSSGGSAAAVAARIVPLAHANDGGGSIRIPAACCGLFGMKPTRGRLTLGPDVGDIMSGLVCEHAVTRSVRDSAAFLDATEGPRPGDPYYAARPSRPYVEEIRATPGRLRVAFTTTSFTGTSVDADCIAAVHEAAKLCEELGHEVVEASPAVSGDALTQAFLVLWTAGAAATIDAGAMLVGRSATKDDVEPLSLALAEAGRTHTASTYLMAVATLQYFSRVVARFMEQYDALLTPTLGRAPLPLGSFDAPESAPLQPLLVASEFAPFTPLQNITGQPAMNVPLHWNAEGLPIGVQFGGRYGDEATLFRLAAQLEAARPWVERRPGTCA